MKLLSIVYHVRSRVKVRLNCDWKTPIGVNANELGTAERATPSANREEFRSFSLGGEQLGDLSSVVELFQIEQRLLELGDPGLGENARREQAKFPQNLVLRHRIVVASLGVEDFLAIAFAVTELDLEIDSVASLVA